MKNRLVFPVFCLIFSLGCGTLTNGSVEITPALSTIVAATPLPDNLTEMLDGQPVRLLVVSQKFSIEANALMRFQTDDSSVSIASEDEAILISFIVDENKEGFSMKELLDQYFAAFEKRQLVMEYQPPADIMIDGNQGVRIDFSGHAQEQALEGSAIAIQSDNGWTLVGVGMANTQNSQTEWKDNGLPNFEQMLASIVFLNTSAECPVSTDDTYGYTPENPIKVGGDVFGGASRERAYLDHLLNSNGGAITYKRSGSQDFGDITLDIYVLTTSPGNEITLYVDMYNYTSPQAPRGFTCQGAFPLSLP